MRIYIAGGHGQIAMIVNRLLADAGHTPVAIIRNAAQSDDVIAAGAEPLVLDLENTTVEVAAGLIADADALVFAAGSGPHTPTARSLTMDRDGAILFARAAVAAGVKRFVMLSSINADGFDPESTDAMEIYRHAKSDADAVLRQLDLDWTILRPGPLTNDGPTGTVAVAERLDRAEITRADVAAVIAELVTTGAAVHKQFEVVGGTVPIAEAVGPRLNAASCRRLG